MPHPSKLRWRQMDLFPVHRKDRLDRLKAYQRSKVHPADD